MTPHILCPTDLITVLMTLGEDAPHVMLLRHDQNTPTFEESHHSLQKSLCHWAETLTNCPIGYMEQLYTFTSFPDASPDTALPRNPIGQPPSVQDNALLPLPHIHITYLALSQHHPHSCHGSLYHHFPWEDRRTPIGAKQLKFFQQHIIQWAGDNEERHSRIAPAFGLYNLPWDDTRVLERYELLWESGLVPRRPDEHVDSNVEVPEDERRLLATALSRLRARIRYSSAIFDLLPPAFTLLQLQQAMETLSGRFMHKPNFRRLVLHQKLVEETGSYMRPAAGRPAKLYRFCPAATGACYFGSAFLPLD